MALQIIHQSRILVLRGQHAKIQVPAVKACGKDLRLAKHQNIHDVIPYLRRSRSCKSADHRAHRKLPDKIHDF